MKTSNIYPKYKIIKISKYPGHYETGCYSMRYFDPNPEITYRILRKKSWLSPWYEIGVPHDDGDVIVPFRTLDEAKQFIDCDMQYNKAVSKNGNCNLEVVYTVNM